MSEKVKCPACKKNRPELTVHGICWPCHMGRINIRTRYEGRGSK